jgi:hypothetical protein
MQLIAAFGTTLRLAGMQRLSRYSHLPTHPLAPVCDVPWAIVPGVSLRSTLSFIHNSQYPSPGIFPSGMGFAP